MLVDTSAALEEMLAALDHEPYIALDTESDSLYRYHYKVCVIQVSIPSVDFVVDPLRLRNLDRLGVILADPAVVKVFHAADNDILVLKRDFGFRFASIFDTMLAARILGWPRVSLAALLAEQFDVKLDKHTQLTDWGARPLTPEQLAYARCDTHYLLPLHDLLARELNARHRWREAQEAMAALPDVAYVEKAFDPDGFWRSKGARELSRTELAVLRELYLWRDQQARAMDRPPFKVVSDTVLIALSHAQPQQLGDLPLSRWQLSRFGEGILKAIERGRNAAPPVSPVRQQNSGYRPDPSVALRFDRLRLWRNQRAADRGVDSDVVLSNEILMAIARARPARIAEIAELGVMGPWKLEEYGQELLRVLAAEGES